MQPPLPCPTATWHNNTYAAIDPTQAALSQSGKTIIIAGAGSGIGRQTAIAFAKAGAKHIILIGRTNSALEETKKLVLSSQDNAVVQVSLYAASITDVEAVSSIARKIGQWDTFILAAGYISLPGPLVQSGFEDYWQNYETNVKSLVVVAQAFIPTANPARAGLFALTAGAFAMGAKPTAYLSGYFTSKLAQAKMIEYLTVENPSLFAVAVHPGMVDTAMLKRSGADPKSLPMDDVNLPADYLVYLAQSSQSKTAFLNGKTVFANWDVDELEARKSEIESGALLTVGGIEGWPFA